MRMMRRCIPGAGRVDGGRSSRAIALTDERQLTYFTDA
jgi:hypothetical protein